MSLSLAKIKREDSFEDFEFFDVDDEDLLETNQDVTKSKVQGAVEKLGSGVALIFSALCSITEEQGMTVSVPVKAVATTAATTLTGSLIGGVPGMAVGLVAGAYLSYRRSPNRTPKKCASEVKKFTLREVLNQMTLQQKKDLLKELLACLKHSNVRLLVSEMCKNEQIRRVAIQILSEFLFKKMGFNLSMRI